MYPPKAGTVTLLVLAGILTCFSVPPKAIGWSTSFGFTTYKVQLFKGSSNSFAISISNFNSVSFTLFMYWPLRSVTVKLLRSRTSCSKQIDKSIENSRFYQKTNSNKITKIQ